MQKNKRGDSKVESNDSPEIPDRGETSDIPGLPSGVRLHPDFRIQIFSESNKTFNAIFFFFNGIEMQL